MAVREIAASFEAVCDCCRATETMTSKGRPKYWIDLHILRDAYDWQGAACADGSVKLLLCLACSDKATKAMNAVFDEVRAAQVDRDPEGDETRSGSVERSEIEPGGEAMRPNPESGDHHDQR